MKKCAEIKIVVMSSQESNILQFNQNMKSDKMSNIIQADLESLIKKWMDVQNNPEKSLATKIDEHILCGCSMSTMWAFDNIEHKHA